VVGESLDRFLGNPALDHMVEACAYVARRQAAGGRYCEQRGVFSGWSGGRSRPVNSPWRSIRSAGAAAQPADM
jgi:hypothetical protein